MHTLQDVVFEHMEERLKLRCFREGDNARKLVLNAKYKTKKPKKERLYIYIENALINNLSSLN